MDGGGNVLVNTAVLNILRNIVLLCKNFFFRKFFCVIKS